MLRAGIFLDVENLVRSGGWGIRFRTVKNLVESQSAMVVRANAYMAVDRQREHQDDEYFKKKAEYRDAVRREGFHLVLKEVQRYQDEGGEVYARAEMEVDLAVDAMLQAQGLDYILIGSSEGNLAPVVRALQSLGKRVDLLAFSHVSDLLRREVDNFYNGYLIPGILPEPKDEVQRLRGVMHHVIEEKGFGFLTVQTGLGQGERRDDVFLHINDYRDPDGYTVNNEDFANLKTRQAVIEFELVEQEAGKFKAVNAAEFEEPEW